MRSILLTALLCLPCLSCLSGLGSPAVAQDQGFSALARVLPADSRLVDQSRGGAPDAPGVALDLGLSQGVPYRLFTLADPYRLVVDFQEVDWTGLRAEALDQSELVRDLRFGSYLPGWSRMVLELAGPMAVETAALRVDAITARADLAIRLAPTDKDSFVKDAGAPEMQGWDLPEPEPVSLRPETTGEAPLVVMLDPGHGGLDPGAEAPGGVNEKTLMLRFAYELGEQLVRSGDFEVVLTREGDYFVSLERRIAMAHQVGADVFLSLHADSLAEGLAYGSAIYVLAQEASDAASATLAERHNRSDLLAGSDLSGADDVVADIMLDLARQETQPRSEALAEAMVDGLRGGGIQMYRRPIQWAGFSVLKSADIPSILIELGFMSSPEDLERLVDPSWRAQAARSIVAGLQQWHRDDEARKSLVRQ